MTGSTWEPPTKPRPARTTESSLWGTPAGQVTASKRFAWNQAQTDLFRCFIRDKFPNHKSCDLAPLLRALDLDGYNAIRNHDDESVYQLIVEKVRRKIGNTERDMRGKGVPLDIHAGTKSEPALTAPSIDQAESTVVKKEAPHDGLVLLSSIPCASTSLSSTPRASIVAASTTAASSLHSTPSSSRTASRKSVSSPPSTASSRCTGRTDVFAPYGFERHPRQEHESVSTTTKVTKEGKFKSTIAKSTAEESLRKRQAEREGLVSRMDVTLRDFGEELMDAHQAPEETDEWYEQVDVMKKMYDSMRSMMHKLKNWEGRSGTGPALP